MGTADAKGLNKWIVLVLAAGAVGLVVLVGSSSPVGAAAAPTQVVVTNPSLAVTGTVGAAQSGAWTVTAQPAAENI